MDISLPSGIIKGIISGKKNKNNKYEKAKLQKIIINNIDYIQLSLFTEKQVFHSNYSIDDINNKIIELLESDFNNLELTTSDYIYSYRITSKGKVLSNRKKADNSLITLEHNRKKKYLIEEGMVVPPLIDLGVMMPDGRVVKASYDKFKQINRFLEIVDDVIKDEKHLNIIDFGCGKSYLTFILYYYFRVIRKIDVNIIGLDLKEDVIDNCNNIANKYGYDKLKFYKGNISDYSEKSNIDMIVTLHACDTATDFALYHAINMKCKFIFSVPCCQHEINNQLSTDILHPITKFGILKDRYSAIFTDAIRANILQYYGYKTNVMEFVDIENSPKNLLIRAILTNSGKNKKIKEEVDSLINEYRINQTLYDMTLKNED
ncbi:MAG: SAM-dependent methyltransferase [Acholeplasmatales bacterium]|nr:SAM-dependent methyltransferase [Acholeplasmatales bacterium]